ncbi:hypothetical protein EBZ37_09610 [bacterium]|nr:hypothetical protein [bacterium]
MSSTDPTHLVGTACFLLAILHTFSVQFFQGLAARHKEGSVAENFFHLLGEVEVVFGIWAAVYLFFVALHSSASESIRLLEAANFTEPAFVFVIMVICATRPVLKAAEFLIDGVSRVIPASRNAAFYFSALVVGPILGSFITEPAAMTVTALLLFERVFSQSNSLRFKYATLGLLFVNVSIGGTLTPYAAPPVLMVASKWNWDLAFMLKNFGWKAAVACIASTLIVLWRFHREIQALSPRRADTKSEQIPVWVVLVHLLVLAAVVMSSHHMVLFAGIFMFFLGLVTVTREYQVSLKLREGLLVAFFLGGLVVLGGPQRWWLEPVLTQLSSVSLFFGSTALTAVTDNAALTFLGAQVPGLSEASKYALVSGAVAGGGLTVIANAPNPAGYGILNSSFGEEGISPLRLATAALVPTFVAMACFWFF